MKHTYTKRDFHNPEQLTRQQVGAEFRLLLPEDVRTEVDGCQLLSEVSGDWEVAHGACSDITYRVPLATPLPDGTILSSNEYCFADELQKLKVYCAGPMTGVENYNFDTFYQACDFLEKQGYEAINPAKLDAESGYTLLRLNQLTPTEFQEFLKGAMKRDLEAIQSCDALVLLPGWEGSKGARAEKAVAEWGGLRIGYLWSERGDGFRLTWEDERQHDPKKPQPDADGWIPHVPGDPMPCDGDLEVDVKFVDGDISNQNAARSAVFWNDDPYNNWTGDKCPKDAQIIAWRPHQPKQPLPYNSDERAEWDVEKPSQATTAPLHAPGDAAYVDRDSRGNITGSGYAANDPKGAAGALKAPMWLLPASALQQTAWVHGLGAAKYRAYNWRETGVCASTYISAIMRHLDQWRDGEDIDKESGKSHIAHIAASCNILMDAQHCGKLVDDRSKLN